MGLPPIDEDPDTNRIGTLLRREDAPEDAFVNDFTNPLLNPNDTIPQSPAEADKTLRDVGDFPQPPDSVSVEPVEGRDGVMEVVGFDAEGNRLGTVFRGDSAQAQDVASRVEETRQRAQGQDDFTGARIIDTGPPGIFEGIAMGLRRLAGGEIDETEPQGDLSGTWQRVGEIGESIANLLRGGGGTSPQTETTQPTEAGDTVAGGEEQEATTRLIEELAAAAPDQVSGDALEQFFAGGVPDTTQRQLEAAIGGTEVQGREFTDEEIEQRREAVEPGTGERIMNAIQGGTESANEFLANPEVQRGIAQLAQLFGRPEDPHQNVAQQVIDRTTQQIQAQQIRDRLEGERVENIESPSVVTTTEDIEARERGLDIRQQNADTRRLQARAALSRALAGLRTDEGADLPEIEQGTIDDIIETVTADFAGGLREGAFNSTVEDPGRQIALIQAAGGNVDPLTIRSLLTEEERQNFNQQVVDRLSNLEGITPEQAETIFGSIDREFSRVQPDAGEGVAPDFSATSEQEFRDMATNAEPGDVIQAPNGSAFQINDDGSLVPLQ